MTHPVLTLRNGAKTCDHKNPEISEYTNLCSHYKY